MKTLSSNIYGCVHKRKPPEGITWQMAGYTVEFEAWCYIYYQGTPAWIRRRLAARHIQ